MNQKIIDQQIEEINKRIQIQLHSSQKEFKDAFGFASKVTDCAIYAVEETKAGRFRPLLLLNTYATISGKSFFDVLDAAVGMEFIHSATLVLDDLPCMDNATNRRGRSAAHRQFGEATAILASVYLLQKGIALILENAQVQGHGNDVIKELEQVLGSGLVAGQEVDLMESHNKSPKILEQSTLRKNKLMYAAVSLPAIMLSSYVSEFKTVGEELSSAYQIFDDFRDLKPLVITGKDQNQDKNRNKQTILSMLGTAEAKRVMDEKIESAKRILQAIPGAEMMVYLVNWIFSRE